MKNNFEVLDSIFDSIAIIDSSGLILFTNIAWRKFAADNSNDIVRTSEHVNYLDVCLKSTGEIKEDVVSTVAGIKNVIRRELEIFELEYGCHSIDEQRWFLMRCTPLIGSLDCALIVHVNITKQKLSELEVENKKTQLKEISLKLQNSFYKIVHDIQSPLNSIEGLINLSKLENLNLSSENLYMPLISKSVYNLKNFIKVTLNSSVINNKIESINFNSLVNDFFESIKYSEKIRKIEIEKFIEQTAPFYTYKSEILSVISNLISNSVKYYDSTKGCPYVKISIIANEYKAIIRVKDNGIGINKEMISKIFELNFQVNKSTIEGFGIGLSLVKRSIELMNGEVNVTSKFGLETEFTITIPNLKNTYLSNELIEIDF
ncbi:MAG: HAMP domain-containing sensor histidine kinase [Bacteroidetes bacterium]|nr:HAMP domain-containing sensor histidine kinase [Bacteroidota bacterium]